jgi:hypothetical protein
MSLKCLNPAFGLVTKSTPTNMNQLFLDGVMYIDNSRMEKFVCPREGQYSVVERLKPKGRRPALESGGSVHEALDELYRHDKPFGDIANALAKNFVEPEFDEWRTADLYIDALQKYMEKWKGNDFQIFESMVEIPFARPLGTIEIQNPFTYEDETFVAGQIVPVIYIGKIDLIVRDEEGLWIVDHKTASMTGAQFWDHFDLGSQTIGYTWAAQQTLPDKKILGSILNAFVVRRPTKTGKTFEFDRKKYRYRSEHVAEWQVDTLQLCAEILFYLGQGYFPKRTQCCIKYRPYGKCEYHDVCMSLPARRDDAKEVYLTHDDWTPLKSHGPADNIGKA